MSAIDRLVREFREAGGGRVSAASDGPVVEARGDTAGDVFATDWLTRDALGVTAGDILASVWVAPEFLGD